MTVVSSVESMEKSFFKYIIPAIVSTMLGGFYIVVDGFFVGNSMGDIGLTAINLVYPIGTLLMATAVMLGMGGSVIMSTYLGEGNIEGFNKAKVNTFISLILASIILTVVLLLLKYNFRGQFSNNIIRFYAYNKKFRKNYSCHEFYGSRAYYKYYIRLFIFNGF